MHWLVQLDLKGAVARMRDLISTDIQFMSPCRVAGFLSRPRSHDHSFLSSMHIFYSIIDSMWLLSISLGTPTSLSIL